MLASVSLLIALPLCSLTRAEKDSRLPVVQKQAQEMYDALVQGRYEKFAERNHPRVLRAVGGPDELIKHLKQEEKDAKKKGIVTKAITAHAPEKIVEAKGDLITIVRTTWEIVGPDGKRSRKSFVIGVSSDEGKTWTFVWGELGKTKILQVLPHLPRTLELPKLEEPAVEK
jgi:hypothetical protein